MLIRKSFGSKVKDTYSWRLEEEVVPKLKAINWGSFKKRAPIYFSLSLLMIPLAFYMSYFEFKEGLRSSTILSLSIASLILFLALLFWIGQNSKFFLPKKMRLMVFENGAIELFMDKNIIEMNSYERITETENHVIVMAKIIGVQTPVPIPKDILKKVFDK